MGKAKRRGSLEKRFIESKAMRIALEAAQKEEEREAYRKKIADINAAEIKRKVSRSTEDKTVVVCTLGLVPSISRNKLMLLSAAAAIVSMAAPKIILPRR